MVTDLSKHCLAFQLNLVEDRGGGSGRAPVRREAVIAGHPLRADITVHLHVVGLAVGRLRGDGHIRERQGLLHEIRRLLPDRSVYAERRDGTGNAARAPRLG